MKNLFTVKSSDLLRCCFRAYHIRNRLETRQRQLHRESDDATPSVWHKHLSACVCNTIRYDNASPVRSSELL